MLTKRFFIVAVLVLCIILTISIYGIANQDISGNIDDYMVVIGDFHMHTTASDGRNTPLEMLLTCRTLGYDVISITDHNTIYGNLEAQMHIEQLGMTMIMILGEEVTLPGLHRHYLSLDIETAIHENINRNANLGLTQDDIASVLTWKQGGLFIHAHPAGNVTPPIFLDEQLVEGFEIVNHTRPVAENILTIELFEKQRYPDMIIMGNSDAHSTAGLGGVRNMLFIEEFTTEAIMEAIRDKRVVVVDDESNGMYGPEELLPAAEFYWDNYFPKYIQLTEREVEKIITGQNWAIPALREEMKALQEEYFGRSFIKPGKIIDAPEKVDEVIEDIEPVIAETPVYNTGLEFTGSNTFVELKETYADVPNTFEAWINVPTYIPDNIRVGIIIGSYEGSGIQDNNINFEIHQTGSPRIWWNGGQQNIIVQNEDVRTGEWVHLAIVRDDSMLGSFRFYLNGELIHMALGIGNSVIPERPPIIGADYRTPRAQIFNGKIGELRVWSTPRSPQEIKAYMHAELTGDEEGLLGYWKFKEGSGNTIKDSSPYENHGTIFGAMWYSSAD